MVQQIFSTIRIRITLVITLYGFNCRSKVLNHKFPTSEFIDVR